MTPEQAATVHVGEILIYGEFARVVTEIAPNLIAGPHFRFAGPRTVETSLTSFHLCELPNVEPRRSVAAFAEEMGEPTTEQIDLAQEYAEWREIVSETDIASLFHSRQPRANHATQRAIDRVHTLANSRVREIRDRMDGRDDWAMLYALGDYVDETLRLHRMAATTPMHSTAAVAEQLGIAPRTVQQHAGKLGIGQKHGRDLYFTAAEVEAMRQRVGQVGRPAKQDAT